MKKITLLTLAFTVILGAQMLAPTKSEAQITCSTDFYSHWDNEKVADTRTDFYGNDDILLVTDLQWL